MTPIVKPLTANTRVEASARARLMTVPRKLPMRTWNSETSPYSKSREREDPLTISQQDCIWPTPTET